MVHKSEAGRRKKHPIFVLFSCHSRHVSEFVSLIRFKLFLHLFIWLFEWKEYSIAWVLLKRTPQRILNMELITYNKTYVKKIHSKICYEILYQISIVFNGTRKLYVISVCFPTHSIWLALLWNWTELNVESVSQPVPSD